MRLYTAATMSKLLLLALLVTQAVCQDISGIAGGITNDAMQAAANLQSTFGQPDLTAQPFAVDPSQLGAQVPQTFTTVGAPFGVVDQSAAYAGTDPSLTYTTQQGIPGQPDLGMAYSSQSVDPNYVAAAPGLQYTGQSFDQGYVQTVPGVTYTGQTVDQGYAQTVPGYVQSSGLNYLQYGGQTLQPAVNYAYSPLAYQQYYTTYQPRVQYSTLPLRLNNALMYTTPQQYRYSQAALMTSPFVGNQMYTMQSQPGFQYVSGAVAGGPYAVESNVDAVPEYAEPGIDVDVPDFVDPGLVQTTQAVAYQPPAVPAQTLYNVPLRSAATRTIEKHFYIPYTAPHAQPRDRIVERIVQPQPILAQPFIQQQRPAFFQSQYLPTQTLVGRPSGFGNPLGSLAFFLTLAAVIGFLLLQLTDD